MYINWISYSFLLFLTSSLVIEFFLQARNKQHIKKHFAKVPDVFADMVSLEQHQQAANYTLSKAKLSALVLLFDAFILLLLTVGGGINFVYELEFFKQISSPLLRDITFIIGVVLGLGLLHLPISIYSTFSIEARFGFNKTTCATFCSDLIKQSVLQIVLGGALLWMVLILMQQFLDNLWWLWAWIFWSLFSLVLLLIYPTWIAPLFNKFKPLTDESLKTTIENLLHKTGFASSGIYVMDGSKRSSHGNAYFTGFGKNKRIVFFDTLLKTLTPNEVEAVLAHELGHYAHGHIKKRLLETFAYSLIGFAIIGYILQWSDYFAAFQVNATNNGLILMVAMQTLPVFFFFLGPLGAIKSRKHEFEADSFAVKNADGNALISALVKLYRDNASTLTPDPLYSAYHASHPPANIRINHIKQCINSND